MDSFLQQIEAAFTEPLVRYGFSPVKQDAVGEPYYYDLVRYENSGRSVQVYYEHTRDAYCNIDIDGYGAFQPVSSIFVLVRGLSDAPFEGYQWTRDPQVFAKQAKRGAELLQDYCEEFLSGDIPAFRRRYRELFLVQAVRNARYNAAASHEWEYYDKYQAWLTDYMTAADNERVKFDAEIRRKFGLPKDGK
jgi:hypothetical protein